MPPTKQSKYFHSFLRSIFLVHLHLTSMAGGRNHFHRHSAGKKTESQCHSLKMTQDLTPGLGIAGPKLPACGPGAFHACFSRPWPEPWGPPGTDSSSTCSVLSEGFPFLVGIEARKAGQGRRVHRLPRPGRCLTLQVAPSQVRGRLCGARTERLAISCERAR